MKLIIRSLAVIALGLVILLPGAVSAQSTAERQEAFCALIDSRQAAIADAFIKRVEAYEQSLNLENTKHSESRELSVDAIKQTRTRADHKRSASYELIKSKQNSDENRLLTEAYAAKVTEAVNQRRISFDSARASFLREVDRLISSRDDLVRNAVERFMSDSTEAFESARQECNSGTPAERPRIRQTTVSLLTDARLDYNDKMHGRQDFKAGVRAAIRTRSQAYDNAVAEFERTMQSIRTEYSSLQD